MKDKCTEAIKHLVNSIKDVGFYTKETKAIKSIVDKRKGLYLLKKDGRTQ